MASVPSAPSFKDDAGNSCVPCFIDGKPIQQTASASFPVVSARKQSTVHYGQTASPAIAEQAVDAAFKTFRTYKLTPVHERQRLLYRAAEILERRSADAVNRQMVETSCDNWSADLNVKVSVEIPRRVAGSIEEAVKGELPAPGHGATALVFKEPVGPVLLIPPWNAAIIMCVRSVAAMLAAGCTVVLKASELCPWSHQLVMEVFHEAGFPPGAVNMVMADRPDGPKLTETIIAHPGIRKVEFIGSAAVGAIIGAVAAKRLKPVLMELGDQSPAIVLEDADLARAAKVCAVSAMAHQGQVCFSTERIIVHAKVHDDFVRLLVDEVKAIAEAAGKEKPTAVTNRIAEKAKAAVDGAIADGAKFVYGNADMSAPAAMAASILTNVNRKSKISTAEAFAPTVAVLAVDTDEQAVEEANSRNGGLAAAIFTRDYERGIRMAREMEFGGVNINNSTMFMESSAPATGIKGSGWGSNNGYYGIREFLYNKSVTLSPLDRTGGH